MSQRFASQLLLVVNGLPILHVKKVSPKTTFKRETVQGITPDDEAIGWTDGPRDHALDVQVYVPTTGDIPWGELTDATIALQEKKGFKPSVLYTGCFVTEEGDEFSDEGGAMVKSLSMKALRKVSL